MVEAASDQKRCKNASSTMLGMQNGVGNVKFGGLFGMCVGLTKNCMRDTGAVRHTVSCGDKKTGNCRCEELKGNDTWGNYDQGRRMPK